MKLSLMPESRRRCHSYLRVSGISCAEERERLIESSLQSGKEPLVALHEILIARQEASNPPCDHSHQGTSMNPAPFLFFWERQGLNPARPLSDGSGSILESFLTGVRGWILNAVRIR